MIPNFHACNAVRSLLRAAEIALATLAIAACASAPAKPDPRSPLALYQSAAGAPVLSMPFFRLDSWQPLDDEHLVVWTNSRTAWLLRVWPTCNDLELAPRIGLTSSVKTVHAKFDKVLLSRHRECPIDEIRPIDLSAYKRARAEARAAQAASSGT